MKDVIFKIFDVFTEKADFYTNKGSLWLIFTDEEKWVIMLQSDGTLWYNYNFFKDCFKYFSLDVIENEHFITEWVEDTIQNGVRHTKKDYNGYHPTVEDTIQNGVRHTMYERSSEPVLVENTLQNGVRHTENNDLYKYIGLKIPYKMGSDTPQLDKGYKTCKNKIRIMLSNLWKKLKKRLKRLEI